MELRKQLQMYSGKFKEFQEAMTGSNAMFETLKKELDQVRHVRCVCAWATRCVTCWVAGKQSSPQAAEAGRAPDCEGAEERHCSRDDERGA